MLQTSPEARHAEIWGKRQEDVRVISQVDGPIAIHCSVSRAEVWIALDLAPVAEFAQEGGVVNEANRLLLLNGRRIHDEALSGFVSRACRQVHTKRRKGPEPTFVLNITAPKEAFSVRCECSDVRLTPISARDGHRHSVGALDRRWNRSDDPQLHLVGHRR